MIDYGSSQSKKQYTRHIGENGFLGADFSTAPIFASPRRFRDLKNVWKDYKSGSGVAIETIPGYRDIFTAFHDRGEVPNLGGGFLNTINGIHKLTVTNDSKSAVVRQYASSNGSAGLQTIVGTWWFLHSGRALECFSPEYEGDWHRVPGYIDSETIGEGAFLQNRPSASYQFGDKLYILCYDGMYVVRMLNNGEWETVPEKTVFVRETVDPYVPTTYIDGQPYEQKNMLTLLSREKYSEESVEVESGTTHFDIVCTLHEKVKAENFASGTNKLKNIASFVIDGTSVTIGKNTTNPVVTTVTIGGVDYVSGLTYTTSDAEATTHKVEIVYKSDATQFTSYKDYDDYKDRTTFNESNPGYLGTAFDAIVGCTICASFDDRIFLAGNPKLPNTIFYTQRDLTGYNNPTFFGVLNYNNLGTSNAPITALVPSANSLYALKDDSATDPTMYVLTGQTTEIDLIPRIYTVESGLPGIGCKGAACNFLDDIVFMSKNGVIGIDKQAVNLERTLGDRSVLINGRLTREDPTKAIFAEWEGYLTVLFTNNGHLYLADSRAYTQGAGYEWYFVDSVGTWENEADDYEYSDEYVNRHGSVVDGTLQADAVTFDGGSGFKYETENAFGTDSPNLSYYVVEHKSNGNVLLYSKSSGTTYKVVARGTENEHYTGNGQISVYFDYTGTEGEYSSIHERYAMTYAKNLTSENKIILVETSSGSGEYYQVKPTGEKVCTNSTVFHPATCMVALNDRILFGTNDGKVLTFNTDKRGVQSSTEGSHNFAPDMIRPEWYTFCGHRIESYVETEDDDAGVANATKDTVKRSVVVDLKALLGSRYKVTTYTDRDNWQDGNAATGAINDYSNVGFGATNLKGDEHVNVQIRERARKWVHKRYRVESNGFKAPFGLYRITYNFEINGRIK